MVVTKYFNQVGVVDDPPRHVLLVSDSLGSWSCSVNGHCSCSNIRDHGTAPHTGGHDDEDTGVDIVERDVFLCLQLLLLLTPLLSVSGESLVSEAEILNTSSSLTLSSLTVEASPPRLTIIMRSVMKTQWNIINYHMIHWKIEKLSCLFLRSLLATKFIRVQGIKRLLWILSLSRQIYIFKK